MLAEPPAALDRGGDVAVRAALEHDESKESFNVSRVSKKGDLLRKTVVPVFCDRCGNTGHLPRLDEIRAMHLLEWGTTVSSSAS